MTTLFLNLYRINEKTFYFDFPPSNKINELAVVKVDGILQLLEGSARHSPGEGNKNLDFVYLSCNLVCDTFINERQSNVICKFPILKDNEKIKNEPINPIYHKLMDRPNVLTLKLVDSLNNLIDFNRCDLHVELHLK